MSCLLQKSSSLWRWLVMNSLHHSPPGVQCCCCYSGKISRTAMRLEKLGVGPDGKPLPIPNTKKVHPRMYKVLLVNQDGSTYTIRHRYPHRIITLPLDLSTLSQEQLEERERVKQAAKARVYVEEEFEEDETWTHDKYRDLI